MKNVLYLLMYSEDEIKCIKQITDKFVWFNHATESGLPIIPVILAITNGSIKYISIKSYEDISNDIFIKPTIDKGGKDIDCFIYSENEIGEKVFVSKKNGEEFDIESLFEKYKSKSNTKRGGYIVQPRIKNHPSLAILAAYALVTARIITIINEGGNIEIHSSHFRIPANQDDIIDNMHAGGYSCNIDSSTGRLGSLMGYGIDGNDFEFDVHPISKEKINGKLIPFWKEAKKIVKNAHKIFLPIKLIGWDVCFTEEGPFIVEANIQPCTDGPQRRKKMPYGSDRFGELVAFHIKDSFTKSGKNYGQFDLPSFWEKNDIDQYLDVFFNES